MPLCVSILQIVNRVATLCKVVEMAAVGGKVIDRCEHIEPVFYRDVLECCFVSKLRASVLEAVSREEVLTEELHQLEVA